MSARGRCLKRRVATLAAAFCAVSCGSGCASGVGKVGAPAAPAGVEAAELWDGSVPTEGLSRYHPVVGTRGMVVADDRDAAEWGAEILRRGGNAIDAAVATGFAMAATRPHYAALGGGGFLVYCPHPEQGRAQPCQALDYREKAPAAATRDMYVRGGEPRTDLSQNGALASGVPGVPAGLLFALEKWGTQPRRKLLARAIELARRGFLFTGHEEAAALGRWKAFNDESKRLFGCALGARHPQAGQGGARGIPRQGAVPEQPCPAGTLIRQPDLARVLEAISERGADGFYRGWVAKKIAEGVQGAGGILAERDLAEYRPTLRQPVTGSFMGMEVVSMPPPSSGGAVLLEMLGYAERADRAGELAEGNASARAIHALAHGMALAYADRAKHFGDPDFVDVPVPELLSPRYLDARWSTFSPDRANLPPSAGVVGRPEPQHTTHFSVIDRDGNAVAITTTVNDNYGSGFVPPGTGVVMNNEMDDFSVQPGVPNLFGLVGEEANAVAPGKRPLSSMAPTIVRDAQGNARIVIGAAGGPRITTSVFLALVNRLRFGMSIVDAVAASRFHQQWKPEALRLERYGFGEETRERLRKLGWKLEEIVATARIHALERFPNGRVWGAPDFRGEGAAAAE